MKKLAIPLEKDKISQHFDHCRQFNIFEIEGKKVINEYKATPPPHTPGALPNWLAKDGITDLVTGGIGPKAIDLLKNANINIYSGVESKDIETIVNDFISETLESGANYCHHN